MNTIKIKIGDIEYTIKQSFRALMTFEKLTGKSVQKLNETIEDVTTLFYAILQANNRQTFKYTFDEFIDLLDEQAEIFTVFTDFLQEQAAEIIADEVKKVDNPSLIIEIFGKVVANTNITPEYFWDEMDGDEATALLNSIDYKGREEWERTRWLGFIQALTQGAEIKKPADLVTFNWEEAKDIQDIRTDEDIKASLQDLANTFQDNTIIK